RDVVTGVDRRAVDSYRDLVALAAALDPGPLARGALHVVLAASVEQLLEPRLVARPPELPVAGEGPRGAALGPPRPVVGADGDIGREPDGDGRALRVLAADDDEVADAPLRELALDRRHPGAVGVAVGAGRVQEDAGVPHRLAAVGLLAPLVLHHQPVIEVG